MAVTLGPDLGDGQRRGSPTNQNSLQPVMGLLRANSAKRWVAGHLLNSEFGGSGTADNNLTPLTHPANHAHSVFEGHIKRMLVLCYQLDRANPGAPHWYGVRYKVDVDPNPYALVPTPADMHSYASSHIELRYKFITLDKFPPGSLPHQALQPPDLYDDVLPGDPHMADLQAVVVPNFAPSANINTWTPFVNGIRFYVEIHNEP